MKKIIIAFLVFSIALLSAEFVEIGTGQVTDPNYGPFYNFYENNRTQTLYLSSEMPGACIVNMLSFDIARLAAAGYENLTDFSIKINTTSDNSLTPGAFYDMAGAQEVFFNSSYQLASALGWVDIDIDDFVYDGGSNLIIEVLWGDNGQYTSTYYKNNKTESTGVTRMLYGYSDTVTPPNYSSSAEAYSNIRVHYTPIAGYPGLPTPIAPAANAVNVALDADLSWTFGADTETYDLYFGTENPPTTMVITNQTAGASGSYDPGDLTMQTDYYWRLVCRNSNRFELTGPVWHFTTIFPTVDEDFETGDFSQHDWQFEGNADWQISSDEAYSGVYSAHNGTIAASQTSVIKVEKEVTDDGNITFWRKTNIGYSDHLKFYINDDLIEDWSSSNPWEEITSPVTAGTCVFRWEFSTGTYPSGNGCWIDYISFPPTTVYDNDLSGRTIAGPDGATAGTDVTYNITVKNIGVNDQSAYTVKLMREGAVELASMDVTDLLAAGDEATHALTWSIPDAEPEAYTFVYGLVVLAGDENPGNNDTENHDLHILPMGSVLILSEGFESGALPTGWTEEQITGDESWAYTNGGHSGNPSSAYTGNFNALLYHGSSSAATTKLITPEINLGTANNGSLTFMHAQASWASDQDELHIYYKNASGAEWTLLESFTEDTPDWTERIISLPNPSTNYYVAFEGVGQYGYGVCIDDIEIIGNPTVYDNDIAAQIIDGATLANAGNSEPFDITVKNVGSLTQNAYSVALKLSDGTQLASLDITTPLNPDETAVHTLIWNIPADQPAGMVAVYGEVTLAGDENPGNNTTYQHQLQLFPPGILQVMVGDGTELNYRTPVCFFNLNSLTETLYFPDELGNQVGMINAISYFYDFDEAVTNRQITVWMGETTQSNLTDGWIPATQLTQVFNGMLSFAEGENQVDINLDTPYTYNGSNLVLMVHRPMDTVNFSANNRFYLDETPDMLDRTRYERDDTVVLDPMDPPEGYSFEKFPNTLFTFFMGEMGELEGYVYDDQNVAIPDAQVTIDDLNIMSYTDENGFYHIGNVLVGTHQVTGEKFGYSSQTQQVEILEGEVATLDFTLTSLGQYSVSGYAAGSDAPTVGLDGATVSLSGFASYNAVTNTAGYFEFPTVYGNVDYTITISYEGYDDYIEDISVGATNLDLGTCVLNEYAVPPGNIVAVQNDLQTEVSLSWSSPGAGGGEFRYDDDVQVAHIGFSNTPANGVFGAVHPHNAVVQEIQWMLVSDYAVHPTVTLYLFGLNSDGSPDQTNILFQQTGVPNTDDEWNSYLLDTPINAPNGFLVGVGTPGLYTSIALDDGVDEPWPFVNSTQMSIEDYTNTNMNWVDIGNFGFEKNMMIRAYGVDFGLINFDARGTKTPVAHVMPRTRSFESYNIYRFLEINSWNPDDWTLVGDAVTDTLYTDASWAQAPNGIYQYAITSVHTNGIESQPAFSNTLIKTLAGAGNEVIPVRTALMGNYPNPFNPTTEIIFGLKQTATVHLSIYNTRGQKVKTLVDGIREAGTFRETWNGQDDSGKAVSSGIYFYRLQADGVTQTRKMMLMK